MDLAREVVAGATEFHWRGAAIHAYYALILECRDALRRWGFTIPRRDNMHSWVRLRLVYATDADLRFIGRNLEDLVNLRNKASYDMSSLPAFASPSEAQDAIRNSANCLNLLDQIDSDPTRRTAAIASIRP